MEVWKIIFRSKWVISRFQPLIFQGVVPGIYLDSPWPVRVPKKSPFGLIRTFYSPPFSAGYVYVHVYVCVCTYIYIHTYIYIYPLSFHHCFIPPINAGRKQKQPTNNDFTKVSSNRSSASNFSSAWTSWKTCFFHRNGGGCNVDVLIFWIGEKKPKNYEINGMGFTISMTWYVFSIR